MSEAEDDIRIIPDSTIIEPFGIRIVSLPRVQNKQEAKPQIDEPEFDDTGESLLHMVEQERSERSDHPNQMLLDCIMPW